MFASSASSSLSSTKRISWSSLVIAGPQGKKESRAVIHSAFGPNAATVTRDNALHRRQADSGSFKFSVRMQPLKWSKELVGVCHIEPGTVIAHKKTSSLTWFSCPNTTRASGRLAVYFHAFSSRLRQAMLSNRLSPRTDVCNVDLNLA